MSNIVPQAPQHNRTTWRLLEEYCRQQLQQDKELYIVAGTYGQGGTGDQGQANIIANSRITVPTALWKVIVILPVGSNDLQRVDAQTRTVAVWIPNTNAAAAQPWSTYRLSIDEVERRTGYDFLNQLSEPVQQLIESRTDQVVVK